MIDARLVTDERTDRYTLGRLILPEATLYTIERPWIPDPDGNPGGKPFESCVPGGRYRLVPHDSKQFGKTWALVNEGLGVFYQPADRPDGKGRYAVLIHVGNWARDVVGCIAIGMNPGDGAVRESVKAMRVLRGILPWTEHALEIVRHPHLVGTAV